MFLLAPCSDLSDVDSPTSRDPNRDVEALPVVPVVEAGEAISARVGRRKHQQPPSHREDFDRFDSIVAADSQGPGRKLDIVASKRVKVLCLPSHESDRSHRFVQMSLSSRALKDEVEVDRLIHAGGVDGGASPSRQDSAQAFLFEGCRDRGRHSSGAGAASYVHSVLPVRLGRLLRRAMRSRRSSSGSVKRPRYRLKSS